MELIVLENQPYHLLKVIAILDLVHLNISPLMPLILLFFSAYFQSLLWGALKLWDTSDLVQINHVKHFQDKGR